MQNGFIFAETKNLKSMNYPVLFGVALVPLILGSIWYNPKVLGNAWMESSGVSMPDEKPSMGEMMKIFIPVYIFSLLFATILMSLSVHQFGAMGMIGGDEKASNILPSYAAFMADYGQAFRTFKHGALHGFLGGLFMSLFLIGTTALFERKSWKYIMIHVGFYVLCGIIMGGLICAFI